MFSLFKKEQTNNKEAFIASDYERLRDLYNLNNLEIYISRFDNNNEAKSIFKDSCLQLQNLKIYRCLGVRLYSSMILNLDQYKPGDRLHEFIKLTRRCLTFIFCRKVNVLLSGELFNHKKHLGFEIKTSSNITKGVEFRLINSIIKPAKEIKQVEIKEMLDPVIADFVSRVKLTKSEVYVIENDTGFLDIAKINENIYKMKMDLIKPFLKAFLKSEYCKDNVIQSINFNGKKRQVLIVAESFKKLMCL